MEVTKSVKQESRDFRRERFKLAIDYDVVVSGVRKKYGENISDEKCRSFFDKIIQLPFTMPVNTYSLKNMVDRIIGKRIKDDYRGAVTELIDKMLNANPRAFKRLANSFYMTELVNKEVQEHKENDKDLENALILGSLCIQISVPLLYNFFVENAEDLKNTLSLPGNELQEAVQSEHHEITEENLWKIEKGMSAINNMIDHLGKGNDKIYSLLSQTLRMSTVTNIGNSERMRSAAMKITEI